MIRQRRRQVIGLHRVKALGAVPAGQLGGGGAIPAVQVGVAVPQRAAQACGEPDGIYSFVSGATGWSRVYTTTNDTSTTHTWKVVSKASPTASEAYRVSGCSAGFLVWATLRGSGSVSWRR
ncbi:hypothetical protein [Phytohabitans rumicis]|uniref:Uncharacterized protein n=1 Tax=Phytohabitans rumicis TaxID=1076125 RepID=A0A6V8KYF9_9ACTN|nr:hypothetical protein [Phytohabitans rumicis]GFJ87359.1 hypothetical protein Prum_010010 [Phytohabitans rumicis]